jgi:hypothetical protein
MIDPAQIPDEVVEAAAVTLMGRLMVSQQDALHVWSGMYEPEKEQFRREARAALAAGLAAWPGSEINQRICSRGTEYIILPLQETQNG